MAVVRNGMGWVGVRGDEPCPAVQADVAVYVGGVPGTGVVYYALGAGVPEVQS